MHQGYHVRAIWYQKDSLSGLACRAVADSVPHLEPRRVECCGRDAAGSAPKNAAEGASPQEWTQLSLFLALPLYFSTKVSRGGRRRERERKKVARAETGKRARSFFGAVK